jgi:hypothetical protein
MSEKEVEIREPEPDKKERARRGTQPEIILNMRKF